MLRWYDVEGGEVVWCVEGGEGGVMCRVAELA